MSQLMHSPNLLQRLFGRSQHPLTAKVHAHALGAPLLVHPEHGEHLIGAFLHGAVDTPPDLRADAGEEADTASTGADGVAPDKVAILNISGALVSRPMPDVCGPGPISYTAIRRALDEALADSNVGAVIMRLDSPGGMASGLFDLTDYIASRRGTKRIIALVDDMAYSACYGIGAACDEIWVSRTSGVGSVGVVGFHVDVGGADAKAGVKVTPIYSGARKIDFNPHFPLSEEAKNQAQAESDVLWDLFVTSVARYRGMDAEAIRATQAGTFRGAAAVEAGFADHVGTLHDVLAELANPAPEPETPDAPPADEPEPEAPPSDPEAPDPDDDTPPPTDEVSAAADRTLQVTLTGEQQRLLRKGALTEELAASDLPAAAKAALLGRDLGTDQRAPAEMVAEAKRIVDVCVAAGVKELAADLIKQGLSAEQARTSVAAAKADVGPELVTTLPALGAEKSAAQTLSVLDGVSIYQQRGNRHVVRS